MLAIADGEAVADLRRGRRRRARAGEASGRWRRSGRGWIDSGRAPGEAALAAGLGALIVPPGARTAGGTFFAWSSARRDAAVAQLPIAGLRVAGRRLVALRPIVRAVRPSDTACERPAPALRRRVAVIADAAGRSARARSARRRRSACGSGRRWRRGPRATRGRCWGGGGGPAFHVAVHARVGELGGVLELAGWAGVGARAGRGGPRGGAGGAGGVPRRGRPSRPRTWWRWGFLASPGARRVVAALRGVDDGAAARLTRELYRSDVTDLAQALARLQEAGAGGGWGGGEAEGEAEWLKFAVFGRATCGAAP